MNTSTSNEILFRDDFDATNLEKTYGDNGLLLYALALHYGIENIDEFATNALTDGADDKKLDVCYIDEENRIITLAQGYYANNWGKVSAPANKASDLITASAWLFSVDLKAVPEKLRPKIVEVRNAISTDSINRVELVFVHNCFESTNVDRELEASAAGVRDILRTANSNGNAIVITYKEVGINTINEWYSERGTDILVDGWINLPDSKYIEEEGEGWKGIALSVPGSWIRNLFITNDDKLFSANFRDYMGAPVKKDNINYQIKQTVVSEPQNFWIYNNGITALTRKIDINSTPHKIHGISIINGAQTSGALGESDAEHSEKTKVQLRIVEVTSEALISKAILYTNTQNDIKPSDRKSNDPIQIKLKEGLAKYNLEYCHRRSKVRVPRGSLTASNLGSVLCAFHGDPQTAYRNSRDIFDKDETYEFVFRDVTPEHAFLVFTLSTAIDNFKLNLKKRISNGEATRIEESQYDVLIFSASKHFLLYVLGVVSEQILNHRISNLKGWKVKQTNISPDARKIFDAWREVLEIILPYLARIMGDKVIYDIERSPSRSKEIAEELSTILASYESINASKFMEIRKITNA